MLVTLLCVIYIIFRKGNNRLLTVTKKESNQTQTSASSLNMIRNSRQQICNLLQRFPLTTKERQELMPQMERNPAYDGINSLSSICESSLKTAFYLLAVI